jgi:signal transduction histidine kinase/PleD family two-component response regulator
VQSSPGQAAGDRTPSGAADFLAGGGESGARMRAVDWSRTALGPPETWPRSLKTIVRMMLDSRYAMWMLWGPEYTFFCNDAYLPTVGIRRAWVMGTRSDKVWAEIWPDVWPRIEQVLTRGESTWDEGLLLFLERSGFPEETYHTFSYSPVYDDDNRIAGMLCVVTEVTERVQSERGLSLLRDLAARATRTSTVRESLNRLMAVLETDALDVPFATLMLLDDAGLGTSRLVHFGNLPQRCAPAELSLDQDSFTRRLARVVRTGEADIVDLAAEDSLVPARLWPDVVTQAVIAPIQGAKQAVAALLIMGVSPRRQFDASYRRFFELVGGQFSAVLADAQTYEAERARAESLAELDRAKTQFFSNVSHEFRTPLTLMLGPLEDALADASASPALRERLSLTHRNAQRLLRLVNSLLDFSRIEAGRTQASFEPTDIVALTHDLASTFRSAVERAGLTLTVTGGTLSRPVFVDRAMWEKIVLNLLSNAFKFTLEGGIEVRIGEHGGDVVVEFIDTGVGVPADSLPRLFERFYRVQDSGGRTHEGTGIGLALVHELVRQHGGSITASSRVGSGTTFRIAIPFGRDHLPAERIREAREYAAPGDNPFVQEALEWNSSATRSLVDSRRSDHRFVATFGARILLADDNADMRGYFTSLLTPDYRLEAVTDGEEALAAARRERPELIVSDVMMPRLDGFGLIKELRADPQLRDIPVILVSARAGEESRIEGLDAGADDYLVKPFSARELLARVGAMLERTRLHALVVDEQRHAREAAQLRSEQFKTLIDEAPMGVFLVDSNLRVREVNPTARPGFGVADPIGMDFREVVRRHWDHAYAAELIATFEHTLATGEPFHMPERVERRADRQVVEAYEWRISRIPLPEGGFGVVSYFRDISQQVQVRMALETADRQKDEFLAMLAHELRNPLAPIRMASELLARTEQSDERAQSAIDIVKRQVNHLTRLVDDLLDISRITRARIELRRQDVALAEVIAQALETVEPMVRDKHHDVTFTSGLVPLMVNGDPARLVQCIANLLTNAIKYTDGHGRIHVEAHAEGEEAVITVSDNGTGIAPDLLPHIFDLFVQSKRTLDRSQGGLGIGLSVVRRLIEMHGGSVSATSPGVGQGAKFTIRLPRVAQADVAVTGASAPAVSRRRALVVDDNQDAAESLAMLLSLDGHDVQAVFTPEQALERVSDFHPEVMLLDIGLPGMDGYEVARRVRAMSGGERIRLIALTGYGQTEDRRRALAAGFDDHLVKPVEPERLAQSIEDLNKRAPPA